MEEKKKRERERERGRERRGSIGGGVPSGQSARVSNYWYFWYRWYRWGGGDTGYSGTELSPIGIRPGRMDE